MIKMGETNYGYRGKKLNAMIKKDYDWKVKRSREIIIEALTQGKRPAISSSFGKDSVVLTLMVYEIDDTVPVVFIKTGVQPAGTVKYMRRLRDEYDLNVVVKEPKKNFWEIKEKDGYPKQSRNSKTGDPRQPKCCYWLKEEPMERYIKSNNIDMNFTGLIGDEGRQRRWAYIRKGSEIYRHKAWNTWKCIPLIFWTEADIWRYHKENDILPNPIYEKYGISRSGCVVCTGYKSWEKEMRKYSEKLYKMIKRDIMKTPKSLEEFEPYE